MCSNLDFFLAFLIPFWFAFFIISNTTHYETTSLLFLVSNLVPIFTHIPTNIYKSLWILYSSASRALYNDTWKSATLMYDFTQRYDFSSTTLYLNLTKEVSRFNIEYNRVLMTGRPSSSTYRTVSPSRSIQWCNQHLYNSNLINRHVVILWTFH